MERTQALEVLVLDKTGTLTQGKPALTDVLPDPGFDANEVLRLAASAEHGSEHPLGAAIRRGALERRLAIAKATRFAAVPGRGIEAEVEGREVLLGNRAFLKDHGVTVSADDPRLVALSAEGKTPIPVAIDGVLAAMLAVADQLKPEAAEAVDAFRKLGLDLVIITGDVLPSAEADRRAGSRSIACSRRSLRAARPSTSRSCSATARSSAWWATASTTRRRSRRRTWASRSARGPTSRSRPSDVTLMRGDLRAVATAIRLSRATMRTIRRNLFFAFAYNVLAIPIAAGVLYESTGWLLSPAIASAAMSLSSLSVVLNSLRLRNFSPELRATG